MNLSLRPPPTVFAWLATCWNYHPGMRSEVQAWLNNLSPALHRQARFLTALIQESEADPRVRILVVGCSVGRGVADALSDLDVNLSVAEDVWPAFLVDAEPMLRLLGEVVDLFQHEITGLETFPHRRFFVQYRDGLQLDLVVQPASLWKRGRSPDMVVLMDLDNLLDHVSEPSNVRATVDEVREWAFLGWEALANCGKYLARGSLWEAHDRLTSARGQIWRIWAVAQHVPQPVYGLTAILDHGAPPPTGIERTVCGLDEGALRSAAVASAELLEEIWPHAIAAVDGEQRFLPAFGTWVKEHLRANRAGT